VSVESPEPEVYLACSKCGARLPEGAQYCLKCGKPVAVPAADSESAKFSQVKLEAPPVSSAPAKGKRSWRPILLVVLGILLIGTVWTAVSDNPFAQGIQELVGWKHDHTILDNPFTVGAHTFRYYKFALPEGSVNVTMMGQFTASADSRGVTRKDGQVGDKGSDNTVEVYVLSEPAFTVWQNGFATSAVYESGRVSEGNVQAELPAGAGIYYLVFSNKFSPKSAKSINANVLLRYKSWLPDWLRRVKGRVLNWLGL